MSPEEARPADRAAMARRVALRIGEIDGVIAVVHGRPEAGGEAGGWSDRGLGIYYHAASPPPVSALRALVNELNERNEDGLISGYGEWGPWANGGGQLWIGDSKVSLLYREIERVAGVIQDCRAGHVTCDYDPGHPHGFHNHIYLAEIALCTPLFDPGNTIAALKLLVAQYPAQMRRAIVERYMREARSMLDIAGKAAARGDVFEVAGCLFRVVAALVQVLFAVNEQYFVSGEGALDFVGEFELTPKRFVTESRAVLSRPGDTPASLMASVERAERLIASTREVISDAPLLRRRRRPK